MTKQTRSMSLVESVANTGAGFALSLLLQMSLFSVMKIETTTGQNLIMSVVFTVASLARGYFLRRVFLRLEEVAGSKKCTETCTETDYGKPQKTA